MNSNRHIRHAIVLISLVFAESACAEFGHNEALQLAHKADISRHLARDRSGTCFLLLPTEKRAGKVGLTLQVSRNTNPKSIEDFSGPLRLPKLSDGATSFFSAGIVVDDKDQLHLIWTSDKRTTRYSVTSTKQLGINQGQLRWKNPLTGKNGSLVLAKSRSYAGDICRSPDGRVWLSWLTEGDKGVVAHVGIRTKRGWRATKFAGSVGTYPPTLFFTDNGKRFRVACGHANGFAYYAKGNVSQLGSKDGRLVQTHSGGRPALVETPEGLLAAFGTGLFQIGYAFPDQKSPRQKRLSYLDLRFKWDVSHSTRMVRDQYGIPWLFWINDTRQHVFYARWLGTRWSKILNGFWLNRSSARFAANHLSIESLGVQHGFGADKSSIGLVIRHHRSLPSTLFHILRVPTLKSQPGKKVMFFDLKEVQRIDGVQVKVNRARKFAGNPVIGAGRKTDFDSRGAANVSVIKENGLYRAWYSGLHRVPGSKWPFGPGAVPLVRIGYAESKDGRTFKKKLLRLASFGPHQDTNMVSGLLPTPIFRPTVPTGMHIDPLDPDKSRRFKLLRWLPNAPKGKHKRNDVEQQSWLLYTSADGLSWRRASYAGINYPAGKPSSFSPQSLFYDKEEKDPKRKYKAYGFTALNNDRRGAAYAYSSDAVEWTSDTRNPVFDPFARATPVVRSGKVEQIHDVVVWKHHQYYLALYQYQRSGTQMTVELAMSRDGETFTYVNPGEEVVVRGTNDAWDCDSIAPSVPLMDDKEIKVYYSGYRFTRTKMVEGERACGLATLRLDGFTHLQLEKGRRQGSVTTIPVARGTAKDLIVNAACSANSKVSVELVDPKSGKPLAGFSRRDHTPLSTDSLAHTITWGQLRLSDVRAKTFQIRIHLKGDKSPKVYSFRFR